MLKFRRYKDRILNCIEMGFGDTWAVTSYLLRMSEELKKPIRVHTVNSKFKNDVKAIIPHLDSPGEINFVDQAAQMGMEYCKPYSVKFVPTKKQWNPSANIVAYQFDGNHLNVKKNLPPGALASLINSLNSLGYEPVDVGHKKSISFIIDTLSQCNFFIGCPSGIGIASMSVGNPIYLITRNINPQYVAYMKNCHYVTRQDVQMFRCVEDFLCPRKVLRLL